MATRINITQFANFDIHDESNLAQWRKIWKQGFEFYLTASGMDNHSQMRALLLHSSEPDVQDIFMHLENVGETCKAAMDALNHLFEPKRNVVFQRMYFVKLLKGQMSHRGILSRNFVNLPPRVKLLIRILKSSIISLTSARLIAYVVAYCKNPILYYKKLSKRPKLWKLAKSNRLLCSRTRFRLLWQG